jgi:CheY-specific phosphatase CheX
VTVTSVQKLGSNAGTGNPNCDKTLLNGTPSSQCVLITYSAGFGPGITVVLAVNFNKDATTIINNDLLAGAQYTAIDNKGFATTTLFGNVVNGFFTANSQNPDLTTPNVLLNHSEFQNASAVKLGPVLSKCTPPYITVKIRGQLVTVCPDGNLPDGPD